MRNDTTDPNAPASVHREDPAILQVLADATSALFATEAVAPFVDTVFQRLAAVIGLDGYLLYRTVDRSSSRLALVAHGGVDAEAVEGLLHPESGLAASEILAHQRAPTVIEAVQRSTDPAAKILRALGVTACACHPLPGTSHVVGAVCFLRRDANQFATDELMLLHSVCDLIGIACERHWTGAALRESEARYRALAELNPDATLVIANGRSAYGNAAAARLLGAADPREILGRSPFDCIVPEFHDIARERIRQVLEEKRSHPPQESRWRRLDGSTVDVEVAIAAIAWRGETALQVVARDITERKRTRVALRQAKEEAERASMAKSQFLSTMSHELRTPLTAILGLSDLLQTEVVGSINAKQQEYLSRIKASAWQLLGIIDEILALSRSEASMEEARLAAVDVAEIARGVAEMLGDAAQDRGLDFRLRGAAERVIALTDGGKIRRILTNLVANAIRYTETGAVEVELHAEAEYVELRVRDTGPGIRDDLLDEIFEPFVQVDRSATREKGGTGLGLAICRRLARLLGGDVLVESEPRVGSTFTLRLPRRAGESVATGESSGG